MKKFLYITITVLATMAILFGGLGMVNASASGNGCDDNHTTTTNDDDCCPPDSANGGDDCCENGSRPHSGDECCEDHGGNSANNNGDECPEPTSTNVPPTATSIPSTATDIPSSPTPKSSPTPTSAPTSTTVPTNTTLPSPTNTPTVAKVTNTPTQTSVPATATSTVIPTVASPTATADVKPHGKPVATAKCDSGDKILADNGEDIFWFDSKLGSKINITKSLGGLNTHGSFDPISECPRMVFGHRENAGSAPFMWLYDGTFHQIFHDGKPVQGNNWRWSSKGLIAFQADGYLYTIKPDGTDLKDLKAYAMNKFDWSPNGEILAVTNDDHAVFFMNPQGEILATKSDSYMSELKWMPDQSQICGGERCIYIETLTEGSFVVDEKYADYIAYNPANGAEFVLSDDGRMAIYSTEYFIEGSWMNLDWFSMNKAQHQPIKFPTQSSTPGLEAIKCPSIPTSYTGFSLHDFMWMAEIHETQEELALLCGIENYTRTADQNIQILNMIRTK